MDDLPLAGMPESQALVSRRAMVAGLTGTAAFAAGAPALAANSRGRVSAIAFDAFPIFNSRPLFALSQATFGAPGNALAKGWLGRIFSYMWMVTAGSRFVDFDTMARTALRQSAADNGVGISEAQIAALLRQFFELDIWPDAPDALDSLRQAGITARFLSNLPADVLAHNMKRHRIDGLMGPPISTTDFRTYKPARAAYQLGVDALRRPIGEIGFVASTGWDAMGASWFGYRTLLTARTATAAETLDATTYMTQPDLGRIADFAGIG